MNTTEARKTRKGHGENSNSNNVLMVIGVASEPIEVTPVQLITGSRAIQGYVSGTPTDSEDTLAFAELTGVRARIET
jgi:D-arabinose 1-dehydrogenase-like Zn-dependent alcohol dehydrogenase